MASQDVKVVDLWGLPNQPLPGTDSAAGPAFVTIWFVVMGVMTGVYFKLLKDRELNWPEFKTIMVGTGVLCFWYFVVVLDRWLHWGKNSVQLGYCLLMPFWDVFYALATILILWGNFTILFREFTPRRFSATQKKLWWGAAYFILFIVCLMSMYFVILQFALSVVWMNFSSLNTIDDIATKKRQFELTMNAFFFAFSLLTTVAASLAILRQTIRDEGKARPMQVLLYFANIVLFVRSTAQFGIAIRRPGVSRNATVLAGDIAYGLLTSVYLISMAYFLYNSTSIEEQISDDVELVHNDIRRYILNELDNVTQSRRKDSPRLGTLLDELRAHNNEKLHQLLSEGPLSTTAELSMDRKIQAAGVYLDALQDRYGGLDPQSGMDWDAYSASRASSAVDSIFSRIVGQTPVSRLGNRNVDSAGSNRRTSTPLRHSESRDWLARLKASYGSVPEEDHEN